MATAKAEEDCKPSTSSLNAGQCYSEYEWTTGQDGNPEWRIVVRRDLSLGIVSKVEANTAIKGQQRASTGARKRTKQSRNAATVTTAAATTATTSQVTPVAATATAAADAYISGQANQQAQLATRFQQVYQEHLVQQHQQQLLQLQQQQLQQHQQPQHGGRPDLEPERRARARSFTEGASNAYYYDPMTEATLWQFGVMPKYR